MENGKVRGYREFLAEIREELSGHGD